MFRFEPCYISQTIERNPDFFNQFYFFFKNFFKHNYKVISRNEVVFQRMNSEGWQH